MSDYIWDLLEPATEGFECVNREEVQQGLDEGESVLIGKKSSRVWTKVNLRFLKVWNLLL